MLIGLLSDTHGRADAARVAVRLLRQRGARMLLHCGDVGSESVLDELAGEPAAFVWGNTDHTRSALARYAADLAIQCFDTLGQLELAGRRIAITHGDDSRLVRRILDDQQHDYLFVGHTHVRRDQRVGRVRVVNPGALYRASEKTVATIDLEADRVEFAIVEA